ncbi:MAG TPA: nucleotide exchange factor GrpE [Acidimicrobiales bacterium]|nr:nucleotide exchange factor GrpE [Acidimicrobiales bacterium]
MDPGSSDASAGAAPDAQSDDSSTASAGAEELADEISAEFSELDGLIRERDEYLDSLRRLQADFENYRKRVQRQEAEASEKGAADLVLRLLPVLDTVELALAHHPGDAVAQVASSLEDVLFKEGLERVPGAGSIFDPNEHEAVLHEEGDGPGEVVEVLRSGYRWRGRVLRAAMVKVKGS